MQPTMKFKNIITPSKVEWAYTVEIKNKKVKKYKGFEINHYIGCTNNCSYCADKAIAARFWEFKAWTRPVLKFEFEVALEKLTLELKQLAARKIPQEKTRIIISFMSDPFQPIERKHRLTAAILKELANYKFNIWVLTKSTPFHCKSDEINYYELMSAIPNLHFGISINSLEDNIKREPNAPSPILRLNELFVAKKGYGLDTYASLEPTYEKSVLPVLKHEIMYRYCDFVILGKLNPSNKYDNDYRRYMPECIQFLEENKKPYLIKEELRKVLGLSDEELKPESKKGKTLEDYFKNA